MMRKSGGLCTEARVMSIVKVAHPLYRFGSYQYKRNKRFMRMAEKATVNKAIDRLISQLGCKGKWVYNRNKRRPCPVIVAGDGEFGSRSGGRTRLLQFFCRMKRKAEAMGYLMMLASEFKTSQICYQFHSDQKVFENRSVLCGGCNQARDRYHNGAQDIGRTTLQWITSYTWPEELERSSSTS
ncbi:hypothetical protein BGZ95_006131 [Linnemannia exigua]|uniref:Uncharacterized protein n=1 Tax=Linnemannia exigua TaxID=604196 RepID=A0AAD4DG64_9FUNG|nr:hypothetical protein BGZ95_006131 [Linnemannia exigua]